MLDKIIKGIEDLGDDIAEMGKSAVNEIKTGINNWKQKEREELAKEIVKAEKAEREANEKE